MATDVEIPGPSYGKTVEGPGAYVPHYSQEDWWCIIWDSEGEWVPARCVIPQTPSPNGILTFVMHASGIRNLTGENLKYGPDSYPQSLVDAYVGWMGFDPRVDGLMPLCDWSWRLYSPDFRWEDLVCTLNWRYNLSKSGVGTLTATIGGARSQDVPAPQYLSIQREPVHRPCPAGGAKPRDRAVVESTIDLAGFGHEPGRSPGAPRRLPFDDPDLDGGPSAAIGSASRTATRPFDAHLLRATARGAVDVHFSFDLFAQYNSLSEVVSTNARLRDNFREGQDLWFVWNEGLNVRRKEILGVPTLPFSDARTLTMKYTHTFIF